jgi:uncharacterized membrane protein YbhN (UPF0104 family)
LIDVVARALPFVQRLAPHNLADRILDGLQPLASLRGIAGNAFWSILAWASSIVAGYILLFAFYDAPTWSAALLMITLAAIAIALPAVPGSVGPFEAAVILGLQIGGLIDPARGLPQERAFAFAVLLHLLNVGTYALLGYIGLLRERVSLGEVMRAAVQTARRAQNVDLPAN